jgi:hypothetical protein
MAAEDKRPQKSPFAKLFSSNEQADKQLQKIRDRIYSFAWSRDRRDEAKLDWILSENGVNRNVHLKWMEDALSGPNRHHIDALPCWLLLVNKRISADFTRFIYSVNDLDVLVDLKANDTELNKAKLDKIVNLLQNANFQRYTRSARVRIHFPDKYPFQNLPVFNQHALEDIALALDGFQELTHLSIRVVPMQGPEVYELRLATFPFYPMLMTNWSVRMFNSRTCNWELVGGEQLHHLNLAWDLFQETGSLTATVHAPGDAEKPATDTHQAPQDKGVADVPKNLEVGQKRNGSQKRKGRKLKALSIAAASSANNTTSKVPSADLPLPSSSPSLDISKGSRSISVSIHHSGSGAETSQANLSITELPTRSAEKPPSTVSPACEATETAHQSTSPAPSSKSETTSILKHNSASEVSGEAVKGEHTAEQHPCPVGSIEAAPEESVNQQRSRNASLSSSAPSSVTLGRDQSDDEVEIHDSVEQPEQVETTLRGAGADSAKPARKKRKNRKKGKKIQLTDTAGIQSNDDSGQQIPVELEGKGRALLITDGNEERIVPIDGHWDGIFPHGQRPFPLAEIAELRPWNGSEQCFEYKRTNGNYGVISRGPDLDRIIRQRERKAAEETERQAEKMRSKGKRKTKKVKEVMLRRKEPSDGLRRRFEDTKQLASSKQGSDLRKRISEIVGDGFHRAIPESQVNNPEETDSSNSSPEDTPSSPEQARGLPLRSEYLGMSSVSNRRQPSSSSQAPVSRFSRPPQVFEVFYDLNTGGEDPRVERRNRQMDEQRLVEEVEDSDDDASLVSQYGDEGPPSISDDESQSPEE